MSSCATLVSGNRKHLERQYYKEKAKEIYDYALGVCLVNE